MKVINFTTHDVVYAQSRTIRTYVKLHFIRQYRRRHYNVINIYGRSITYFSYWRRYMKFFIEIVARAYDLKLAENCSSLSNLAVNSRLSVAAALVIK